MISLLMATFNGEKYIRQQLESILNQACVLDEVVIIDDKSDDATVSIVRDFISTHGLNEKWHLYVNKQNCGWKKNFFYGVERTKGDIIFFSDQDDIWHPDKIKIQVEILNKYSDVNVVASKEILYYGGEYCFDELNERFQKVSLDKYCSMYKMAVSGCTMAIRREFYDEVKSYYSEGQAHDEFFWQFGQATDSLVVMDSSTILHRIHGKNESRRKPSKQDRIASCNTSISSMNKLITYLQTVDKIKNRDQKINSLNNRILLVQQRLHLLKDKGIHAIPKLIVDKYNIYGRKRQVFKDILYALGFVK